ncbi:Metallo-hydrolase/oxidoreductase [Peniophora sp. CONT]|nr:Metallo-hydrolase/oxidoreductase [Peniophora sp. CONT]
MSRAASSASPQALTSVNVTFLGTASAQPSSTRNHSSLALRLDGDVWLFDCGEATQHQIQRSNVKMGKINKVFVTHTHGDHIFGLVPLMAARLNGAGGMVDDADESRLEQAEGKEPLEIYGPLGTRAYVRNGLVYSHTLLGAPYVVHELRLSADPQDGDYTALAPQAYELPGLNIPQQPDGTWPTIFSNSLLSVSAAPILHSVPCVGFAVDEKPIPGKMDPSKYVPHLKRTKTPMSVMRTLQGGGSVTLVDGTVLEGPKRRPGRRIVVLGDTYDPSRIAPLAQDADLLIHEATNAHLPSLDPATKPDDTFETVQARTMSRGHSTPQMAGAFARGIGAKSLVLNHFSARYAGDERDESVAVMDGIRDLAKTEYEGPVVCARDFMSFDVEPRQS